MKTLSSTLLAAFIIAIMATSCAPMDESPLNEANLRISESNSFVELAELIEENNQVTAAPSHQPGLVHVPIIGCDTMTTDLVIAYTDQTYFKVGEIVMTVTDTELYFEIDPYSGLKIMKVAYFESQSREDVPLNKDNTPDYQNFSNSEEWSNGKATHRFSIPLASLYQCQAYSVYIQIATMNGPNGQPKFWDAWAWGHDQGRGYIMEVCIPSCGGGQIFQN